MTLLRIRADATSVWPYLLPYSLVVVGLYLMHFRGIGYWSIPIIVFIIIPLLDLVLGLDWQNPNREQTRALEQEIGFRLLTWFWVPVQLGLLLWATRAVMEKPLTWFELTGLVFTTGIATGGLGITIAHEMIHKASKFEQLLGKILLVSVCYGHFYVEHLWGHHKRVSTDLDPATARFGESFYSFWWRSVSGSFMSAWHLEAQRLKKEGKGVFSVHNQMLHFIAGSLACPALLYLRWGKYQAVVYFFVQSFIAFSLLELVNYIEHYGLARKQTAPGRYVRVTPMHSWNAAFQLSNYLLFKLQRHSDHHANAGRRYQILRSFKNSPQMPQGYPAMIVVAMFPPIWFRWMNPRVVEYMKKAEEYEKSGIDMFPEAAHDAVAQNADHSE